MPCIIQSSCVRITDISVIQSFQQPHEVTNLTYCSVVHRYTHYSTLPQSSSQQSNTSTLQFSNLSRQLVLSELKVEKCWYASLLQRRTFSQLPVAFSSVLCSALLRYSHHIYFTEQYLKGKKLRTSPEIWDTMPMRAW